MVAAATKASDFTTGPSDGVARCCASGAGCTIHALEDIATFARKPGSGWKDWFKTGTFTRVTAFVTGPVTSGRTLICSLEHSGATHAGPAEIRVLVAGISGGLVHTSGAGSLTPALTRVFRWTWP